MTKRMKATRKADGTVTKVLVDLTPEEQAEYDYKRTEPVEVRLRKPTPTKRILQALVDGDTVKAQTLLDKMK